MAPSGRPLSPRVTSALLPSSPNPSRISFTYLLFPWRLAASICWQLWLIICLSIRNTLAFVPRLRTRAWAAAARRAASAEAMPLDAGARGASLAEDMDMIDTRGLPRPYHCSCRIATQLSTTCYEWLYTMWRAPRSPLVPPACSGMCVSVSEARSSCAFKKSSIPTLNMCSPWSLSYLGRHLHVAGLRVVAHFLSTPLSALLASPFLAWPPPPASCSLPCPLPWT